VIVLGIFGAALGGIPGAAVGMVLGALIEHRLFGRWFRARDRRERE
jgi:membrane protein YqaA with SNARE-associated domain